MATVTHRLYVASAVATGDNKASMKLAKRGVITAVCIAYEGVAGAAIDARTKLEISKQSASSFTLNDSPASVICHANYTQGNVASNAFGGSLLIAGMSNPVDVNDTIYLHEVQQGTAPASHTISVDIFIQE